MTIKSDMRIRVIETETGGDVVSDESYTLTGGFKTNAEAWRWADRYADSYIKLRKQFDVFFPSK